MLLLAVNIANVQKVLVPTEDLRITIDTRRYYGSFLHSILKSAENFKDFFKEM